jgi:hypothetical protein
MEEGCVLCEVRNHVEEIADDQNTSYLFGIMQEIRYLALYKISTEKLYYSEYDIYTYNKRVSRQLRDKCKNKERIERRKESLAF